MVDNHFLFHLSKRVNPFGEVAEWSKAVDSKSAVPCGYRGFESHPLRSSSEEGQLADGCRPSVITVRN